MASADGMANSAERWERREPALPLSLDEAEALVSLALPGEHVAQVALLPGGHANTNYRVTLTGEPRSLVLRFYMRDTAACAREVALHRLVAGRVPAPEILFADPEARWFRTPWAALSWMEGIPLPQALTELTPGEAPSLAESLGMTAAAIGAFQMGRAGFFGPALEIAEPLGPPPEMTRDYIRHTLFEGLAGERLGAALTERLWRVVDTCADELEPLTSHYGLVHADYKDGNLLVTREGGRWRVSGVLDWEFAYAGASVFDLGSLLRREATLPPGFAARVVAAYRARGGYAPEGWRRMTLLMDMMNLVGFASWPEPRGPMLADVTALIQASLARLESGEDA